MRAHKKLIWAVALATVIACIGWPARADAQGGHGGYRGGSHVVVAGGYYGGYYGYPFWFGLGPVYDPWYAFGYQYPYGPYPPYPYGYSYDPGASIRLEVKPRQAEVYVDGYYAGIVDDFDGVFQRLPVEPAEHEVALYLDGYRTVRQKIYLTPRNTFKLKYVMEKLGPGDQQGPRPEPLNPPQQGQPQGPPQGPPPSRGPATRRAPPPQQPPPPEQRPQNPPPGADRADASAYGTIAVRVQPADADVLIDGEKWRGPEAQDRLLVEVSEGRHTVELRKAGYRTYVTEVEVRRGDTTPLNVSLRTQDEK